MNVAVIACLLVALHRRCTDYIAGKTRAFAANTGLKPLTTPVCSPQSYGKAASFVKTMKRDYVSFMLKPDASTAARNLAFALSTTTSTFP